MSEILAVARADFLERARRPGFLVMLLFAAWLGYEVNDGHIVLRLGTLRGVYNSAWVGALTALVVNGFLSLAGFYLVKGSIRSDLETGVGQILAATPLTNPGYVLAKALSGLAILYGMVVVLMASGIVLQWTSGEGAGFAIGAYAAPLILMSLPAMAMTAALAVLFDAIAPLRETAGNVLYFLLAWPATTVAAMIGRFRFGDVWGFTAYQDSMAAAAKLAYPDAGDQMSMSAGPRRALETFVWDGLDWTPEILVGRLFWLALAGVIIGIAAAAFRRFDEPAGDRGTGGETPSRSAVVPSSAAWSTHLPALAKRDRGFGPGPLVWANLVLTARDQPRWWYVGAVAINVAVVLATSEAESVLISALWIWPLMIWSRAGMRDLHGGIEPLLLSSPSPALRQIGSSLLAATLATAAATVGQPLSALLEGDPIRVALWFAAAVGIPATALALGSWSRSSKLFEVLYVLAWYVGPLNGFPAFDFVGATQRASTGSVVVVSAIAMGAITGAVLGRRRRMLAD